MQTDPVSSGLLSLLVYGVLAAILAAYFVPFIVALKRNVNIGPVFVINLFLGWSLIGWVAALALACMSRPTTTVVVQALPTTQLFDPGTLATAIHEVSPTHHNVATGQDIGASMHQG